MGHRYDNVGTEWSRSFDALARRYWTDEMLMRSLGPKHAHLRLSPREDGPLLRALGLLRRDASMSPSSVHKLMQINHVVALLEPLLFDLMEQHEVVRIADVACGSSQLTLYLAWCFVHRYRFPAEIVGIDRNAALMEQSAEACRRMGLEGVVGYVPSTIISCDAEQAFGELFGTDAGHGQVHGVVALHACDTATDEALALGVRQRATWIAVAPCCHAELARQWRVIAERTTSGPLAPLMRSPHLRREAAATVTDALRTLLVESCGYRVTAMEFVPSEHTPKNTLIRAVKDDVDRARAEEEYRALKEAAGGCTITLEPLLEPYVALDEPKRELTRDGTRGSPTPSS